MKSFTYHFQVVECCNMCGAGPAHLKLLGKRLNRQQGKNPRRRSGITTSIFKCDVCDLIFSDPMPVPAHMDDHYGVPAESYWKPEYFQKDVSYFGEQIATFFRLYGRKSTSEDRLTALDVGAGIGKAMLSMESAGFEAFGMEPSESFYKKALEVMEIDPQRITLSSLEEAQYEENAFDFATFGAVLEHVYDPSASILRVMKWLKPGGLLHIEVPSSHWWISSLANLYYRAIGTDYVGNISPMHPPYHLWEFHTQSFFHHARINNYEVAYYHRFVGKTPMPARVRPLLDPVCKTIMEKTGTEKQLEIWLRKKK